MNSFRNLSIDPYDMIMNRRLNGQNPSDMPIIQYDPNDIKELEEFCKKHGIMGFNTGKMSPKAALSMLKSRLGISNTVSQVSECQIKQLIKG
jgi:hypothetical protein